MRSEVATAAALRAVGVGRRRRVIALVFAATSLAVLTPALASLRPHLSFASDLAIYLLVVVITSVVGGFYPALAAAAAGSLLLNYYFTPPLHTFTIDRRDNVLALVTYFVVATLVSRVVDTSVRRSAVAALAESERARTALLNAVSHDLRTPLASAKASVTSLLGDVSWSDDERRELLDNADTSLDRLTSLVTNLLDLSRLQAGVLPVLRSRIGIDDVVARALDHVTPFVGEADPIPAAIEVDVPDDLPDVVADGGLLERVVANLVQNAVRYAPEGTVVTVRGESVGADVELRVIDHGHGIPAADSESVFAAFRQRGDEQGSGTGLGLGLAIARGFTEAMGGRVWTERTPGGGATLVIGLPAASDST